MFRGNDTFLDMLLLSLLCSGAAILLLYLLTAFVYRGIERLRLFMVLLLLASVIICFLYQFGGIHSYQLSLYGLEVTDLLPVRMADMPYLENKRLLLRWLLILFYLVLLWILVRRRAGPLLLAGVWVLFLAINLTVLLLHLLNDAAYQLPQNTAPGISGLWQNRVRIVLQYALRPRTSWLLNVFYPAVWVLLPAAALFKIAYEAHRAKQEPAVL